MRAMEGAAGAQTQGAASLMCWGWSVLHQGLRGVLSVTEGFNFPPPSLHLHLHSSAGPLRCSSPHSTITLPLLNIYGSQETRSQHQLFYSHTFFFNRLGSSLHNFVFHGFLGGESETSSKFYSCWSDKTRPCGFTDKATVPSCGHGG